MREVLQRDEFLYAKGESTCSTAVASVDDASDKSHEQWAGDAEAIPWDKLALGLLIHPHRRYASCVDDVFLLSRFLELVELEEVDGESIQLLLRALKFLRLCDYSFEDICSTLAHASAYFGDAYSLCGTAMDNSEVGNVLVTLMFIAHCYVQDETCPLNVWHQHLFQKYCAVRTLNSAIIRPQADTFPAPREMWRDDEVMNRLLEIRHYVLRLEQEDLHERFSSLQHSVKRGQMLRAQGTTVNTSAWPGFGTAGLHTSAIGEKSQLPLLSAVLGRFTY